MGILGGATMRYEDWNIKELTGYKPKTTFYMDFSIADRFGSSAIRDTFNRAFKCWRGNVEFITELCMVLNWKIHRWYGVNDTYAYLYNELWEKVDIWCQENLKDEDLSYFYATTD